MKKICAVVIAVVVLQLLSVFALADSSFVSSPSGVSAPTLTQISRENDSCTAEIKVYAYGERSKIQDKVFAAMMTDAYDKIAGSEDLADLGEDVAKLADKINVESEVLVASELFALIAESCDGHASHGSVKIAIEPTVVENFAGLLKYNGIEWEVVDCKNDNGALVFDFEEDAVYSILLHDGTASGGSSLAVTISVIAGGVVALVLVLLVVFFIKKKKNDEAEAEEAAE